MRAPRDRREPGHGVRRQVHQAGGEGGGYPRPFKLVRAQQLPHHRRARHPVRDGQQEHPRHPPQAQGFQQVRRLDSEPARPKEGLAAAHLPGDRERLPKVPDDSGLPPRSRGQVVFHRPQALRQHRRLHHQRDGLLPAHLPPLQDHGPALPQRLQPREQNCGRHHEEGPAARGAAGEPHQGQEAGPGLHEQVRGERRRLWGGHRCHRTK
mmetsp:Transcript_3849/g.8100  ORF Transcript_3849/g.8100 Transcript_3849/m.8100 type:complete len:209 (+) Transcript_3849:948-1574(+)